MGADVAVAEGALVDYLGGGGAWGEGGLAEVYGVVVGLDGAFLDVVGGRGEVGAFFVGFEGVYCEASVEGG